MLSDPRLLQCFGVVLGIVCACYRDDGMTTYLPHVLIGCVPLCSQDKNDDVSMDTTVTEATPEPTPAAQPASATPNPTPAQPQQPQQAGVSASIEWFNL